jgi:hypothetical protein
MMISQKLSRLGKKKNATRKSCIRQILLERQVTTLSDVPVAFIKLAKEFRNLDVEDQELKAFLKNSLLKRYDFIIKAEHIRAFLLDPRYLIEDPHTVSFFGSANLQNWRHQSKNISLIVYQKRT